MLIMLDPQLDSYAKELGAGNRSDGINRALAEHRNREAGSVSSLTEQNRA